VNLATKGRLSQPRHQIEEARRWFQIHHRLAVKENLRSDQAPLPRPMVACDSSIRPVDVASRMTA
jgi:hypothetical protein